MDYSIKINALRKKLNITQEELAHELGVSFSTINRWETGKSKPSKLAEKAINLYCEQLNINTDEETSYESRT